MLYQFFQGAFPWIAIATALAVYAAYYDRADHKTNNNDRSKNEDQM
ncbi:MAG: hypothetical protein J6M17_07900 [Ruminococcus sp.]|nr:hypothetical protein [Ruminococcus sp.]